MIRIGNGFDVHPLIKGRKLVLGGVEVPYEKGLMGHSDGDVLIHAIIDSLLGACGKRDIGSLFPDDNDKYKDIYSIILLREVNEEIKKSGYTIGNIDSIVVAEAPRLSPYIMDMKKIIADSLQISEEKINIKATTSEGLGYVGRGEGISSYAVVCLFKTLR